MFPLLLRSSINFWPINPEAPVIERIFKFCSGKVLKLSSGQTLEKIFILDFERHNHLLCVFSFNNDEIINLFNDPEQA